MLATTGKRTPRVHDTAVVEQERARQPKLRPLLEAQSAAPTIGGCNSIPRGGKLIGCQDATEKGHNMERFGPGRCNELMAAPRASRLALHALQVALRHRGERLVRQLVGPRVRIGHELVQVVMRRTAAQDFAGSFGLGSSNLAQHSDRRGFHRSIHGSCQETRWTMIAESDPDYFAIIITELPAEQVQ